MCGGKDLLFLRPNVQPVKIRKGAEKFSEAPRIVVGETIFTKPTAANIIDLTMPRASGLMFRFEPVYLCENGRNARACQRSQCGEEIFFLVRSVFWRRLAKILQPDFQHSAMLCIQGATRKLGRHS